MFTSNTQEILTSRDRRVSGEDRLACSEVKASQDHQPFLVTGATTLLRALLQPSGFRNDPIWVDVMLSSVQITKVFTMLSGAGLILLEVPCSA